MSLKRARDLGIDAETIRANKSLRHLENDSSLQHEETATGQTSIFPFFTLPRELRDQIYDEVWTSKKQFMVVYKGVKFLVHYESPGIEMTPWTPEDDIQSVTSHSPWFLANKQMLEEAIEQFHRQSFWIYHRESLKDYDQSKSQSSQLLLDLWQGHTLCLPEIVFGGRKFRYNDPGLVHCFDEPFQKLDTSTTMVTNLRCLQMGCDLGYYQCLQHKGEATDVAFGLLEKLKAPKLQTVCIAVDWTSARMRKEHFCS